MIIISPFSPEDQQPVKALILAGLVEHWGFLDPTKNPDLDDIAQTYASATFLVARQDGQIVGTGALVPRTNNTAEIVRMSVARSARRSGIGRAILQALLEQAKASGCRRVTLETTAAWREVVAFYLDYGFLITHYEGGDVYFAMEL